LRPARAQVYHCPSAEGPTGNAGALTRRNRRVDEKEKKNEPQTFLVAPGQCSVLYCRLPRPPYCFPGSTLRMPAPTHRRRKVDCRCFRNSHYSISCLLKLYRRIPDGHICRFSFRSRKPPCLRSLSQPGAGDGATIGTTLQPRVPSGSSLLLQHETSPRISRNFERSTTLFRLT